MKSNNGSVPETFPISRPAIIAPLRFSYVETETFKKPRMGSHHLSTQILNDFNVKLSRTTVTMIRNLLNFHYKKPRTIQHLMPAQIQNRIDFCTENLTGQGDFFS
jgi:hypothetical protein